MRRWSRSCLALGFEIGLSSQTQESLPELKTASRSGRFGSGGAFNHLPRNTSPQRFGDLPVNEPCELSTIHIHIRKGYRCDELHSDRADHPLRPARRARKPLSRIAKVDGHVAAASDDSGLHRLDVAPGDQTVVGAEILNALMVRGYLDASVECTECAGETDHSKENQNRNQRPILMRSFPSVQQRH